MIFSWAGRVLLAITSCFAADPFLQDAPPALPFSSGEALIGGLINPKSGQLSLGATDLIAHGVEPLTIIRHYYSPSVQERSEAPFTNSDGQTISSTYDSRNTRCFVENGKLAVHSKDGSIRYYEHAGPAGSYTCHLKEELLLSGRWIIYSYNEQPRLTATFQLLQKTGASAQAANFIDSGLSVTFDNVRVVTNTNGTKVITVITTGR